jgi:hypothetical protein
MAGVGNASAVPSIVDELQIEFEVFFADTQALAVMGVRAYPAVLIVSEEKRIDQAWVGALASSQLRTWMEQR